MKNSLKRITTTKQELTAVIENKISQQQLRDLKVVLNNSSTTFYADIKKYLTSQLKNTFDKVGYGGSHVWLSNKENERQVIIYIN